MAVDATAPGIATRIVKTPRMDGTVDKDGSILSSKTLPILHTPGSGETVDSAGMVDTAGAVAN